MTRFCTAAMWWILVTIWVVGCGTTTTPPVDGEGGGEVSDASGAQPDVTETTPDVAGAVLDATTPDVAQATPDAVPVTDTSTEPDVPAEPDVPTEPPLTPLCAPCNDDAECGGSTDLCLTNSQTNERFCSVDCATTDGLCPPGALCMNLEDGVAQCVPTGATCEGYQPVSLGGQPCAESALCYGAFGTCVSAGGIGYCTRSCESDADCSTGTSRCAEAPKGGLVCRADWELGPEGCGWVQANGAGIGGSCDGAADCAGGLCLSEGLPETVGAFCSSPCVADSDCGAGAGCGETSLADGPVCIPEACACLHAAAEGTLLGAALAATELHACEAIYLKDRFAYLGSFVRYDPARLKHFDRVHAQPLRTGEWVDGLIASTDGALGSAHPVTEAIVEAAQRIDRPAAAPQSPAEPGQSEDALVAAVAAFTAAVGDTVDLAALEATLAPVPASLRGSVAAVLLAMARVPETRIAALGDLASDETAEILFEAASLLLYNATLTTIDLTTEGVLDYLMGRVAVAGGFDYRAMNGCARDVALAVESQTWASDGTWTDFHVVVETSAGAIVLSDDAGIALLVDTGGHDTYRVPVAANHTAANLVSVAIDLGGDDHYGYEGDEDVEAAAPLLPDDGSGRFVPGSMGGAPFGPFSFSSTSRQGGANLGVALHFDLGGGSDQYRSLRRSQGFGSLGVGVLYDDGGDDDYRCEAGCQGSALLGIGIQIDAGQGADQWLSWTYSQGFAYLRAYGLLADGGGDDSYSCAIGTGEEGDVMVYPSPQRPDVGNSSMCQGFGFGRRADGSDGLSLSGGLGILREAGGHDSYSADVFNQGGGYWFGTGVLADEAGDDSYFGMYYTQAIGAHFAMGMLVDAAGDDTHNEGLNPASSIGFAHDASTTLLRDGGGDDLWQGAGMRGYDSGMSVALEMGGVDTYLDCTLGQASLGVYGASTPDMLALGVFLDGGGEDDYETSVPDGVTVGNDQAWSWTSADTHPGEHGAGADGATPLGVR
jgi:hypothetical protein